MLPLFLLRLACGLIMSLFLVPTKQVNPRFFRAHYLIALGLGGAAVWFLYGLAETWTWIFLGTALLGAFVGSVVWSLEGAPGARSIELSTALAFAASLGWTALALSPDIQPGWLLAGEAASLLLLGTATTAMLMGHSYLNAPTMSMTPLFRLLLGLFVATIARGIVSGIALWFWTREHSLANLDDVTMFLPVRWGLGIIGPLILGFMAWMTARIRSTQSATGILYVVTIFTFLGEVISLVLFRMTGELL